MSYFINKSSFELGIASDVIMPEEITQTLGIQPDRSFKKGKEPGSRVTRITNLWAKSSKEILTDFENLSPHFAYFEETFKDKISLLEQYKKDERFDVRLWIWIQTGGSATISFHLNDQQLAFMNKICNWSHFTLLAGE